MYKVLKKMFKINYIRSYLRALRDYFLNKEEIIKSFALPMKKIDGKKNKDIFVDRNDKQIEFDKNFIDRLRGIINKDVVVSAHWEDMYSIGDKKNFHKQLIKMSDENFFYEVANPSKNDLHFGFGDICKHVLENPRISYFYLNKKVYDTIFRLACSIGVRKFPEVYHFLKFDFDSPDQMLDDIFNELGNESNFPNIFKGEFRLNTKYGVVSFAPIQQMYHAMKILEFSKIYQIKSPRVLEIGAGLGLSAYHARNFKIKDYTILDLSLGSLSQAFFFGSTIGKKNIIIGDEIKNYDNESEEFNDKIKLIQSTELELVPDNIDITLNCDSITEMSFEQAQIYIKLVSKKSKYFLSLNHDNNSFVISEIFKNTDFKRLYRVPSWYRQGYNEELYINTSI